MISNIDDPEHQEYLLNHYRQMVEHLKQENAAAQDRVVRLEAEAIELRYLLGFAVPRLQHGSDWNCPYEMLPRFEKALEAHK